MKIKELQEITNQKSKRQQIKMVVLSKITFEPYFVLLINKAFSDSHVSVNVVSIDYCEFLCGNAVKQVDNSDVIVVIPNFDGLYQDIYCKPALMSDEMQKLINNEIANMKQVCSTIRSKSNALILWFGYEDYFCNCGITAGAVPMQNSLVDNINLQLYNEKPNDIICVDLKSMIAAVGISNAYDNKNKYRWNSPYSQIMIEHICNEIYKQYLIERGITKKCLVLDCDNVLWGGILSEDGIENIKLGGSGLGRPYQDFQRYILSLYYYGVILAVCSKNDLTDVLTMFREHSEMLLKEEHIACFQVNWENKPDNIRRIAETLNISLDSMVFIDDSLVEIEAVKYMLPEVTAVLYERDSVYDRISCFNLKSNVSITDIKKRNETYRTNQSRETLKSQYESYSEYIEALEIKIDIHEALPIEYSRISELSQRTNKCTNGQRYTVAEIKDCVACNDVKLYSLSVSDRFSDLGIVGAFEVDIDTLTLFCLSCRALGREIEGKLLEFIADKHQINKIEFKSTGKNEDIKTLLLVNFPNVVLINRENG